MNNSYFNPNSFANDYSNPSGSSDLPMNNLMLRIILRLNKGKVASFYMTFPDANEWRDRIFTGVVEQAARDHVVISDPKTGKWYLLLTIYLDFIVFDEEINYKVI